MKLEYRILWIDDRIQEHRRDGHLRRIEDYLDRLGFIAQILECEDKEQVETVIKAESFDLILTDFNLDEEENNGDAVIREIRDGNIFTEILFYSAGDDFWDRVRSILEIDRLSYYQISRSSGGFDGLLNKTEWLIKQTVSKLQELTAMRGLMMAETSALDSLLGELAIAFISKPETAEKNQQIFEKANQSIAKFSTGNTEKFNNFVNEKRYENFIAASTLYGKWQILREMVEGKEIQSFSMETLKAYNSEITEVRNKLAHLKHTIIDRKHYLSFRASDGTTWEFNDDRCVDIRRNLKKHTDNLKALAEYLGIKIE